jgi:peptidoglycan hydrolase CwlO-like protein
MLNRFKDSMTTQLVDLDHVKEGLEAEISKYKQVQQEFDSLDEKYNTLLEMLGEREEKILELEQDIVDMKEAFKAALN